MPFERLLTSRCLRLTALVTTLAGCTGTVSDADGGPSSPSSVAGAGGAVAGGGASSVPPLGGAPAAGGLADPGGAGSAAGGATAAGAAAATGGDAGAPAVSACASGVIDPGPSPLRLLTREQYLNTLKDLFGTLPPLADAFTRGVTASDIGAGQGDVSQVELEDFQRAAELVAAAAVSGDALGQLAPCATGSDARDCARELVTRFGARAYRAPITDADDIERHLALYDAGAATDFRHGIELLLRGMLQSSRFLYRVELGTRDAISASAVALSGHEVATRLSFAFWNTLPDAELTDAATSGALSTRAGIEAAAARVLADPRGAPAVRRFLEALIHLDGVRSSVKDKAMFPDWQGTAVRSALEAQARRFFDYVLDEQGGSLATLLTSPRVFVNRELSAYYDASAPSDDFVAQDLGGGRASGLLTLPAWLAWTSKPDQSSPIYRGKFVREMLLCQVPPAPPPDIPGAPEVDPDVSTRERLRQHEVNPACSGCHSLLDPIGFAFEHYDAVGRYRDMDGGQPVDARGEIVGTRELNGNFDGVQELATLLSGSAEVRDCVARQYFRYLLSRFEQASDGCSVERLVTAFRESGADLNTLPLAVVRSDAFVYRRPIDATAAP